MIKNRDGNVLKGSMNVMDRCKDNFDVLRKEGNVSTRRRGGYCGAERTTPQSGGGEEDFEEDEKCLCSWS